MVDTEISLEDIIQTVTVGQTTTGEPGTNAEVVNSGTGANVVMDFTIPRGEDGVPGPANTLSIGTVTDGEQASASITGDAPNQTLNLVLPKGEQGEQGEPGQNAVNPFKGWWPDLATLKAAHTATEGDSAYVKDASPATTWSIYVYDSTASSNNYWADSGTDADTSNVQTFASSQEVNEVHIVNNLSNGGVDDVLSAEQGVFLKNEIDSVVTQVFEDGFYLVDSNLNIGFKFDATGFFGPNVVNMINLQSIITALLSTFIIDTVEDGFFVVDSNKNIGFSVTSTGAHSANLVEYIN